MDGIIQIFILMLSLFLGGMINMNDRKCPICGKSLEGYHHNAIYCSHECKKENEKAKLREKNL